MTVLEHQAPGAREPVDHRNPMRRLGLLLDAGEVEPLSTEGDPAVAAVHGRMGGEPVVAYCSDATRMGGAMGAAEADRIIEAIDTAVQRDCPVVGVWHSGGAKLADGVESMDGVGRMFSAMTRASGVVPQVSIVLGPAAGAAAYGPALTDLVIMSRSGRVFVTGPDVVRSVTGEDIDGEGLGGIEAHGKRSGVAHVTVETDQEAYAKARSLVALLSPYAAAAPGPDGDGDGDGEGVDPRTLLPENPRRAYDVRPLVRHLLDGSVLEESQALWAPNMVTGLGRLGGRAVGVLANNPLRKGGCLDSASAEKGSRFVRMCDSFGVPLLVLVDVPGYMPGVAEEWGGVVRRGAKLLHAFAEASVPRITLITRKSYGGAYIAMNSRSLGATRVLAWPEAEVAVMGADAAVGILHRRALAAAPDGDRDRLRAELVAEQERHAGGTRRALDLGVVDEIVPPSQTRRRLLETLAAAPGGRGRHGNIPL